MWLLLSSGVTAQAAATAHLAWNRNPEPDIVGYRVDYGIASGAHPWSINIGNTTSAGVSNLANGQRYYFVVRARNNAGVLSPPSNQVSYVTPLATPPPTPTPAPNPAAQNFLNVSTRAMVRNGENALIGGFIISGNVAKKVILRAIGPSLTKAGVPTAIVDPILELHNSSGALIAWNNNWTSNYQNVLATHLAPTHVRESAIVATLPAGAYTAVLRGVNGGFGVALCELYDLDPIKSKIVNLSTRGRVETAHNVMIGGFIIGGIQPTKVLLRAIGPSLTRHHISGALKDPTLALHNANGSLIFSNNNWRSHQQQQIIASTIPPSDNRESAIVATLKPGNYTTIVRGVGNSTGVALVEMYNLAK